MSAQADLVAGLHSLAYVFQFERERGYTDSDVFDSRMRQAFDGLKEAAAALTAQQSEIDRLATCGQHYRDEMEKALQVNTAQQERIAELSETWTDWRGETWRPPTALAYAQVCAALTKWQEQAKAAEEQIRLLRNALTECADRLETCAIISGGNTKEVAAMAVAKYRHL